MYHQQSEWKKHRDTQLLSAFERQQIQPDPTASAINEKNKQTKNKTKQNRKTNNPAAQSS